MYQCSDCVNLEKSVKKSQKDAAKAAANLAQNRSNISKSEPPQEDFRCDLCRDVLYQCSDCVNLEKGIKKSQKDAAKAAANLAQNQSDNSKQQLFLSLIRKRYSVKPIARDGDCIFRCILVDQERFTKEKGSLTIKNVRDSVAAHLVSEITSKGCISGQTYEFFEKNNEGVFVLNNSFESVRGEAARVQKRRQKKGQADLTPPRPPTLEEYAAKIQSGMYGGDLEILLLASLYDLTINVFSWHFFDGRHSFAPQVYGSGSRSVSVLFEQDFSRETGRSDHYNLILYQKFTKWEAFMRDMPK